MASPYLGEILMFAGNFAPEGWALCNGQLLPISEFDALFQLIGTTYGGDGQQTFALPDLQGRLALHRGNGRLLAERGGAEVVTLTLSQLPAHSHLPLAQAAQGNQLSPTNGVWAASMLHQFSENPPNTAMRADALAETGGDQPHENMMPFLTVTFIISLFGIFPTPA